MPRLKKTDSQKRAERFDEHYRVGKARMKLQEPEIASALGMAASTLRKYKQNPDKFQIGHLIRLGCVFDWTDEPFLDIIRLNNYNRQGNTDRKIFLSFSRRLYDWIRQCQDGWKHIHLGDTSQKQSKRLNLIIEQLRENCKECF